MLVATLEKSTDERSILRMKGRLCAVSAIYIGKLLEEAVNNGIHNLTLDFGEVLDFDYRGIGLLAAILDFCARDFSEITLCSLPQNITDLLKEFIMDVSGLELLPIDDGLKTGAAKSKRGPYSVAKET